MAPSLTSIQQSQSVNAKLNNACSVAEIQMNQMKTHKSAVSHISDLIWLKVEDMERKKEIVAKATTPAQQT